jgi:mono/diheme cytochrome c family protein
MRHVNSWMWIVGASTLIAGCAIDGDVKTGKTSTQPLVLTAGTRINVEGILDYGTVVFAENPTTLLEAGDFHGYEFDGKAGGIVTITMTAPSCGAPDTLLDLFGPEDANGNRGTSLVENDDAFLTACLLDSQIKSFRLPVDGTYLIAATSFLQEGGGHYKLQLTCDNGACALPGSPTFASTRINQTDIDRGAFTPAALFDIGDFMFETVFRIENGMGNALLAAPANNTPRPNFRQFPNNVHFAAFGAPEAQTCVTCHNVGGDDGAGDANHNIFQIGDGINRTSGVPRNPPTVLGNGLRQRIGEEMTADLAALLASAKAQAASTHLAVTKALTSKGISFGSLVANADGTVNTAGVVGVDADLIVKPFGWKGREATLRRFVEGGFRVHFGLQSQPSIVKHCATPNVNTFGTGANCQDPDGDGVTNEITEGQLTAEAVYMGLRETPVRVPAATAALQTRATSGEALFNSTGCASCHTRLMKINVPTHVEAADTTGGAGITLHLATDTKAPHPALNTDGSMTVELWSDFKRHDVGATLADSKAFNQIAANQFITPPLWGIATSAPYLHDGRAITLKDAILAHAGDALAVRNAFAALTADQQSQIQEFLGTLGRVENVGAAPVDLSGFELMESRTGVDFTIPAGTLVPHGGHLIIARSSTKTAFQTFYGKTLGTNVVFINSAAVGTVQFPQISGTETFTLHDSQMVTIEGPTIAEPSTGLRTFQRTNCSAAAGAAASWASNASSVTVASPGAGILSNGLLRVCISEIADVGAGASTGFEYVELFVE